MKLKKYNIIGEAHDDEGVVGLLEELMPRTDTLFLEALKRGSYEFDVESLVDLDFVYGWNPGKYDNILRLASLNNVKVHGLDSWFYDNEFERPSFDVADWAHYIKRNGYGINLILVGGLHVGEVPTIPGLTIPSQVLPNYFNLEEVLTIQSFEDNFLSSGLQQVDCKDVDYYYVYKGEKK